MRSSSPSAHMKVQLTALRSLLICISSLRATPSQYLLVVLPNSFFLARYFIFDIESVYFDVVSKAVSSVFEVVEMAHVLKILIYELYLFAFISEIEA